MSIIIDDREDPSILKQLQRYGVPVSVSRLDYGDCAIQACDGRLIGFERKRLTDLITSMTNRRLSGHQIHGMMQTYDRVELIVESLWRPQPNTDKIEVWSGKGWITLFNPKNREAINFRQIDSYLYSLTEMSGVRVWKTASLTETASLYASRWHWWQKDYELHRSHDVIYTNTPASPMCPRDPNPVTLVAAQIPGIDAKAWDLGEQFKSPRDLCNATESDWRHCHWTDRKGNVKRFGPDTAKQIVDWTWGRK